MTERELKIALLQIAQFRGRYYVLIAGGVCDLRRLKGQHSTESQPTAERAA
jgi:hypothetical protein